MRDKSVFSQVKVTIGFPALARDYCFFVVVHVSKTGRPVKRNLNAINANARKATEMSMIAVMALRKGLSRKP